MKRTTPPDWFKRLMDNRSPRWLLPPLGEHEAEPFLRDVAEFWTAPGWRDIASRLWRSFLNRCSSPHAGDLVAKSNGYDLVGMLLHYVEAQVGIETFLPPSLRTRPAVAEPFVRRWLYVQVWALTLTLSYHLRLLENPDAPPEEAFSPLYILGMLFATGPLAEAEIARRGAAHIGSHAAMVLLITTVLRETGVTDPLMEQDAERSLAVLERSVKGIRPRLPLERSVEQAKLGLVLPEEIPGQIVETLFRKFSGADTRELLARSLEGELDIAPRAVRDDLVKEFVRERKRHDIEVLFRERTPAEAGEAPSQELSPEGAARQVELLKRIRNNPRLWRLVLAAWEGAETQEEMAAHWGVDPRTVRNWVVDLREMLKE